MESHVVAGVLFACLFLIGLCAIEHRFRASRLPYISWIVLFGVGYGILTQTVFSSLPDLQLTPDVILYIFLPLLIFDSSRKLNLRLAKKEVLPAFLLASLGILVSMFVMAVPLYWLIGLPWIDVLFFAAIMSATDPVAVSAVFSQFNVPEKLKTLLEGESLLNDGTTMILFTLLGGRVLEGKELIFEKGLLFFIFSVVGACLFGILTGWACARLMRRWKALKDHFIGPLLPLIVVYLTFCIAQSILDISGVIAVMSTTFIILWIRKKRAVKESPSLSEEGFYSGFWSFLGDLANAILFFMLGVEIGTHYYEINWWVMPWIIAALFLSRSVVVYGFCALFRFIGIRVPLSWQHVLNLGGLKGALSVALILMIPEDYAYRHIFLCAALSLCLFTLIANPLALRVYLKKNRLD